MACNDLYIGFVRCLAGPWSYIFLPIFFRFYVPGPVNMFEVSYILAILYLAISFYFGSLLLHRLHYSNYGRIIVFNVLHRLHRHSRTGIQYSYHHISQKRSRQDSNTRSHLTMVRDKAFVLLPRVARIISCFHVIGRGKETSPCQRRYSSCRLYRCSNK